MVDLRTVATQSEEYESKSLYYTFGFSFLVTETDIETILNSLMFFSPFLNKLEKKKLSEQCIGIHISLDIFI